MIYLRTGANGTGKTLLTLKEVREKQLAENRPVYWNGRFQLTPEKEEEFGWHRVDIKDWQKVPDGAIFFVDEAHNDFPISDAKALPEYIKMMAEHRSRGFDFYLITQHRGVHPAGARRCRAARTLNDSPADYRWASGFSATGWCVRQAKGFDH